MLRLFAVFFNQIFVKVKTQYLAPVNSPLLIGIGVWCKHIRQGLLLTIMMRFLLMN
jgi:hypothetical protein